MEALFWIFIVIVIAVKIINKLSNAFSKKSPPGNYHKRYNNRIHFVKNIGIECPEDDCNGLIMETISKRGNTYYRCGMYPDCDFVVFDLPIGVKCQKEDCGGIILQKKSRAGNTFYGCSNYPNCKFTSKKRPVPFPCPKCGSNLLIENGPYENRLLYACIYCNFTTNDKLVSIPCFNCGESSLVEEESHEEGLLYVCIN